MNNIFPPQPTQQYTRTLLIELFLSLHQSILLHFGKSSVCSAQTVDVSYDKVYIEVVVVVVGCDDEYVLLLLDLVRFFGLWPYLEDKVCNFSTTIVILTGDDCWKQAMAAFYCPWEALIAFDCDSLATSGEDHPCSLISFFLHPYHHYFVVVLFLRLRSVVIWSCCIGIVVIRRR